jgi:hypothetical protein
MIVPITGAILAAVFCALSWDEDNKWKIAACAIAFICASITQRVAIHSDGYVDGLRDGSCIVYNELDSRDGITLQGVPEYCDE